MDLRKLYKDVTVLIGRELPIYTFITYCDMAVRIFLCRYSQKLLLVSGEYVAPKNLDSSMPLKEEFYAALQYYILGMANKDDKALKESENLANSAYLSLWRKSACGKRIKNERW